jgi:hypothetical protein
LYLADEIKAMKRQADGSEKPRMPAECIELLFSLDRARTLAYNTLYILDWKLLMEADRRFPA